VCPCFLLAARLVGSGLTGISMQDGIHTNRPLLRLREAIDLAGLTSPIPRLEDAEARLRLTFADPARYARSCDHVSTPPFLRMWNPSGGHRRGCQGVFHPSYRSLKPKPRSLLGQKDLSIIQRGGGNSSAILPRTIALVRFCGEGAHSHFKQAAAPDSWTTHAPARSR